MSRMMAFLDRLILSKAAPILITIAMVVGLAGLIWSFWVSQGPTLVVIPRPDLTRVEPVVRRHLESAGVECDQINRQKKVPHRIRARAFGQMGRIYLAYRYPEAAAACLENAIRLDAEDYSFHHGLAHAYYQASRLPEARATMVECQRRIQADPTVNRAVVTAVFSFLGELALKLENTAEAKEWLEQALAIDPENAFALVQLARIDVEKGRLPSAIEHYQQALTLRPNSPEIRRELANAHRQNGNIEAAARIPSAGEVDGRSDQFAIEDPLMFAISELNASASERMKKGLVFMRSGRVSLAEVCLAYAVKHQPDDVAARVNHGVALEILGRNTEALAEFEAAIKLEPRNEVARAGLCRALARDSAPKSHEQAIQECARWRREEPESIAALRAQAEADGLMSRHAESLQVYEEAKRRAPSEHWPMLGRSQELSALGRYVDARKELEACRDLFPNVREVRHTLSRFLATSPDKSARDGAKALEIAKALQQAQPSPTRSETLAAALAETGQFPDASAQMRKAIQFAKMLDPQDTMFQQRLNRVLLEFEAKRPLREPWPFADPKAINEGRKSEK